MKFWAEVSNLATAGTGINIGYAIDTKNAQTKVMVENGATAVIGGLMSDDEAIIESKIPFLSKLPIVGRLLFTTERKLKNNTEILILITPTIVGSPPEAMY